MKAFYRNTVSLLALVFYLMGGVLIEVTHHEAGIIATLSQPVLEQHACHGSEPHVSPDAVHCLACTQANHRVAIETQSYLPPRISPLSHGSVVSFIGQTLETDVLHSGKRGPPRA